MPNATSPETAHKLAVLIDADNTQSSIIGPLLAEVAKYGTANVKRIYGNWTTPQMGTWKQALLKYSLHPRQQFSYTDGKNATDIAMVIDAMDLLYTDRFDGFCLVSSDCDFTPLAMRIREYGLVVYGLGENKTPKPFIAACNKFIFTEVLTRHTTTTTKVTTTEAQSKKIASELKKDSVLIGLLQRATHASSDEDGWSHLAVVGQYIAKQSPEFDSRNYGYGKLGELVRATGLFEFDNRAPSGDSRIIYIRPK